MNFAQVEKVAAAILYEGYILYPYCPTAIKNRQRWNFGTLYPRVYAEAQRPQESFRLTAECVLEEWAEDATLDLKVQFLQLIRQQKTRSSQFDMGALSDSSLGWEEAIERKSEQTLRLSELLDGSVTRRLAMELAEFPSDGIHQSQPRLQAELTVALGLLAGGACKLRIELKNDNSLPAGAAAKREEALPLSFVSAHILLGIHGKKFVSLLDPPDIYREAVAACQNLGVFPVLAGEEPDRSIMFCSPIILYDYPKIAPESEGDFFDGTEMDEMLTLRVLTLTDAEKEEMRNGDPRARQILERTESMTPESMMKAHGVVRAMRDIRRDTL